MGMFKSRVRLGVKQLLTSLRQAAACKKQWLGVRNITDINQILIEGKFWKTIEECPVENKKFNKDFPPLIEENKNQIKGKTELNEHWNILSSGQAPTSLLPAHLSPASQALASHPPACPAWRQRAHCQPPTHQPGPCQAPAFSASRPTASPLPACLPPASLPNATQAPATYTL
ncbi:hypothetical protein DSO57_1020605 [Entomophthora muscae]|uniref:Uncharacterized protein n=1 Tax=Entomophthora muscae TaxID=34485 RepID=A0ACC2UQ38_9FUNG|nr:hypothetical protein DSO57_1020605 [Entomophthora muscae]